MNRWLVIAMMLFGLLGPFFVLAACSMPDIKPDIEPALDWRDIEYHLQLTWHFPILK